MTSPTPRLRPADSARRSARAGFTLIELILVMTLLTFAAALAAPRMASFFRGRTLDQEARRLLALSKYGHSRAVAEGVPVELWIDPATGRYGLSVLPGFVETDPRAVDYALDSMLTISTETGTPATVYEDTGEIPAAATTAIVFNPDGQLASTSVGRILIQQGEEGALALARNRLGTGYEILPAHEAAVR